MKTNNVGLSQTIQWFNQKNHAVKGGILEPMKNQECMPAKAVCAFERHGIKVLADVTPSKHKRLLAEIGCAATSLGDHLGNYVAGNYRVVDGIVHRMVRRRDDAVVADAVSKSERMRDAELRDAIVAKAKAAVDAGDVKTASVLLGLL